MEIEICFLLDPITPGRREGDRYCIAAYNRAMDPQTPMGQRLLFFSLYLSCKTSLSLFYLSSSR